MHCLFSDDTSMYWLHGWDYYWSLSFMFIHIDAQCNAANRSRETEHQSVCDEMTNEYQQSVLQMFVGHLITSAVSVSLLLLAVDPLLYYRFTPQLVCPLKRNRYFFRLLGILSLSQTASGHNAKREMPKLFEYTIKIHHSFLTISSRKISRNWQISIVFHRYDIGAENASWSPY